MLYLNELAKAALSVPEMQKWIMRELFGAESDRKWRLLAQMGDQPLSIKPQPDGVIPGLSQNWKQFKALQLFFFFICKIADNCHKRLSSQLG